VVLHQDVKQVIAWTKINVAITLIFYWVNMLKTKNYERTINRAGMIMITVRGHGFEVKTAGSQNCGVRFVEIITKSQNCGVRFVEIITKSPIVIESTSSISALVAPPLLFPHLKFQHKKVYFRGKRQGSRLS
jgi:hypothetical protein